MSLNGYVRQLKPRDVTFIPHETRHFHEAYSFFPTSEEQITKELSDWPHESVVDVISLFNFLKGKDETPINIDLKKQVTKKKK